MRAVFALILVLLAGCSDSTCIVGVGPGCDRVEPTGPTGPGCQTPIVTCLPDGRFPGAYACSSTVNPVVWKINSVGQGNPGGTLQAKAGDSVSACAVCGPCSDPTRLP